MTDRKRDHIDLAFRSHMENALADRRFYYEPLLSAHPEKELEPFEFLEAIANTSLGFEYDWWN